MITCHHCGRNDVEHGKAVYRLDAPPRSYHQACYEQAELEAEAVAYVVGMHFGVDCEVRASRYIALWGGDSKALKASLERIATTARAIIDEVEALDARKAVA